MPYHWVKIPSSPPRERRNEVWDICHRHGARLCENEIYYDEQDQAYALVELPEEDDRLQSLLEELGAISYAGLVNADERANDIRPPNSAEAS
jgi:hypothetical protein